MEKDYLLPNLRELPYFRAMLRAVEARAYQNIRLEEPILDIGCGDGHFASTAFARKIDVGLDTFSASLAEAKSRNAYHTLVRADATRLPFSDGAFRTVISTSTLEHIQDIDRLIGEVGRVLGVEGAFYFCVPNHQFNQNLSISQFLESIRLAGLAAAYRKLFDRIARHRHLDSPVTWTGRLERSGLETERWWHYFSPAALHVLEWGHFFGLPSLLVKKITGRWNLVQQPWNFALTRRLVQFSYSEPLELPNGVCTFYIAHKR